MKRSILLCTAAIIAMASCKKEKDNVTPDTTMMEMGKDPATA